MPKFEKYLSEANMNTKASNVEVKNRIEDDGIGHAIQVGMSWKDIEDKQLAKMWKDAGFLLDKIERYLS